MTDDQKFTFEMVTVNERGEIVRREQRIARQRLEVLGQGIILEMVFIPGGTFLMGSPETEKDRGKYETPQHLVTVAPFYIGKFPVTQTQWEALMGTNPSAFKGAQRPVEEVSWHDAMEFCERLSEKTGRPYRLPGEAEWEYAGRAGTTTPFSFGETITTELANYNGNSTYASEAQGIFRGQTTDVGSFPPNGFGLYDIHGNVREWCADLWHENYENAPSDASVWKEGGNPSLRLLRGGSWLFNCFSCRSASRSWRFPVFGNPGIGVRVVYSVK